MTETNRNMILAIVLSMVVIFGWQFLVAGPQQERAARQAQIAAEQAAAANPGIATTTTGNGTVAPEATTDSAAVPTSFADRASAVAATSRVSIDTPALVGSINLRGARLDDLQLKKYTETIDENSPIITLLTPSGAPNAYYVEQGWAAASGSGTAVPGEATVWTVEGNDKLTPATPVVLAWNNGAGLVFRRTFAVDDNYLFTVKQTVENQSAAEVSLFPYSRIVREGTPVVSNFFVQHEGPLGVLGSSNLVSKKYSDMQGEKQVRVDNTTGWLGFGDKYWATAVIADPTQQINAQFTYLKPENKDEYQASFVETNPMVVAAGATGEDTSYVFAGAKEESVIASYESGLKIDRLELLIDWGWLHFITKPMFLLLRWLYGILGNFGLAMLAVTVLVKLVFFPLANRSYASMAAMRRVAPEMKALQEKFKEDRAGQQQAMMELYKREKINPLSGCWPLLIQIPVFFALYTVIFTFMLGTFPAGLVIYWSWNNFLSICQQYFIMRRHGADVDLFGNILTSLGVRKASKPAA